MTLGEIIDYYIAQALEYERVAIGLERGEGGPFEAWERANSIDRSRRLAGESWIKIERLLKIRKAVGSDNTSM